MSTPQFEWPLPEKNVDVAGVRMPAEVAVVAAVYAVAGLWLLWLIRDFFSVIPDLISGIFADNAFEFAISFIIIFVLGIVLYLVAALLGVAYLLIRLDPVGRALSVVVFAALFMMMVSGDSVPGWYIVVVLLAGLCSATLFLSPWSKAAFATSPRRSGRPTAVVVSQTLAITYFSFVGLLVVLLLPGLRWAGDLGSEFVVFELFGAAAVACGLRGYALLRRRADRQGRILLTVGAGIAVLAMAILGNDASATGVTVVIAAGIAAPLWLGPRARQWFGDAPLNLGDSAGAPQ